MSHQSCRPRSSIPTPVWSPPSSMWIIKRDDFELTGEAIIFNTETKQGGLGGNVLER